MPAAAPCVYKCVYVLTSLSWACCQAGEKWQSTKATMSPTSHDPAACLRNFPLASRSGASAARALYVFGCACFGAGIACTRVCCWHTNTHYLCLSSTCYHQSEWDCIGLYVYIHGPYISSHCGVYSMSEHVYSMYFNSAL